MKESLIRIEAHGKINLVLNVGGVREDGFHEVSMVMQEVGLYDEVTVEKTGTGITLTCDPKELEGTDNIAYRAAHLMQERFGLPGIGIGLKKRIPVAAGMAGGSSDGAAVIEGIDRLFELGLSLAEKEAIGQELGSDIPFFFTGGTCLAEGRGEIITRIGDLPRVYLVLVKPDFGISTPWSYRQFESETALPPIELSRMREAIEEGDLARIGGLLQNHLEPAALSAYPVIGKIKDSLKESGAFAAMMTGSGPTVFGMFREEEDSLEAVKKLSRDLPASYQVLATVTYSVR